MIKTIAFLSITIVILIFIFVFRETLPLFHNQKPETSAAGNTEYTAGAELKPESYSSGEPEESEA